MGSARRRVTEDEEEKLTIQNLPRLGRRVGILADLDDLTEFAYTQHQLIEVI